MALKVSKEKKKNYKVRAVVCLIVAYIALRLASQSQIDGKLTMSSLTAALEDLSPFGNIIINSSTLGVAGMAALFTLMCIETYSMSYKKNMKEETYGSAKWGDTSQIKEFIDDDPYNNQIFTRTEQVSRNARVSHRNRNILLLGRPGTGKSRNFFKPNLLNANGSVVVTDPKGELLRDCGAAMLSKGYTIKVLNLDEKWKSNHYNPLQNIRRLSEEEKQASGGHSDFAEDDVMILINTIMKNTKSDSIDTQTGDPFWERAEMLFLQALVYYVLNNCVTEEQNFNMVLSLIRDAQKPSPIDDKKSLLSFKFDIWRKKDPDNIGIKQWDHFMGSAASPKMMQTIILTAVGRLEAFNLKEVAALTRVDDMELNRIGKPIDSPPDENNFRTDGKIIYFIITKAMDTTFNFLGAIMYSQLFNIIDANAKANYGSCATTVDLYMDEWAQLGTIPNFVNMAAYMRGLNAGVVIGLQSLSQLKEKYKESWETLLDCCDYELFLGSTSKETLEYFSALLGEQTIHKQSSSRTYSKQGSTSKSDDEVGRKLATVDELKTMPENKAILLMSGNMSPFYSDTYVLKEHPLYNKLFEPWVERDADKKSDEWKENHANIYNHIDYLQKDSKKADIIMWCRKMGIPIPQNINVANNTANIDENFDNVFSTELDVIDDEE